MIPVKSPLTQGLSGVRSASSHLSATDHEVNLEVIQSMPILSKKRLNYDGLVSLDELPAGVTFMLEKIYALSETEAVEILKEYLAEHDEDVNIPEADFEFAQKLVDQAPNNLDNAESGNVKTNLKFHFDTNKPLNEKEPELTNVVDLSSTESITHSHFELFDWSMQVRLEAGLIAYHSPYPEVRAVTEPYDDPSVPCETPRAIIVGLIWVSIDYLFQALSSFNWMTWIKPDNFNLASITGSESGLGLNPIPSFDWNVINYDKYLAIPFYSYLSQYIGMVIGFFAIVGVYRSEYYWTSYLPINSNSIFTNTGESYSVTEVLNSNNLLDKKKYDKVGPPFYSAANLVVYGAFSAIYPFAVLYETLANYKAYKKAFKGIAKTIKNNDPHSRMMGHYKEVPDWCFLCVLVISVVSAILCTKLYPTETPVWGVFSALGINLVFLIPLTTIYSVTGFQFGLNVLVELIVGYALPGNGLALMFIKALGYNIDGQAQTYISDQKMGHYAKIPPRAMFRWQMVSVFIASFISLAIINFITEHIEGYCEPDNKLKFTCPQSRIFYSASIIWGDIGPKRVFNQLYPIIKYCYLLGFLLVFPCIAFKKYGPNKLTKYFQPTLMIGGFLNYAPFNLSDYTGGLYMSIAFM
ncbi:OPT-domain-containing protein [Hyphopichia burtonii NRRL Y-1933]|uniref:OPT-domain-containing protein n=1 Tax=Hyphopichia burtonii NRRL Y-1933 TaxID=984485 RepID=A0A1E4RGF2_9ASCO|nr:OPT-domain-containing protein [Hyphopichia burtonii NRRL Y-1933]ODV66347.1 OPT-domain-containing protein [Hyphopichia burtonii NRRL Y-1933]